MNHFISVVTVLCGVVPFILGQVQEDCPTMAIWGKEAMTRGLAVETHSPRYYCFFEVDDSETDPFSRAAKDNPYVEWLLNKAPQHGFITRATSEKVCVIGTENSADCKLSAATAMAGAPSQS